MPNLRFTDRTEVEDDESQTVRLERYEAAILADLLRGAERAEDPLESNATDDRETFRRLAARLTPSTRTDKALQALSPHVVSAAFDVLIYVGGVGGGIQTIVAGSKAAKRFVQKRLRGQRPSWADVMATAAEAIERTFGERVPRDADKLEWLEGAGFIATWRLGTWTYEVRGDEDASSPVIVTRSMAHTLDGSAGAAES